MAEYRYHLRRFPVPEGWRVVCSDLGHHTTLNGAILIERFSDDERPIDARGSDSREDTR